MCLVHNLLCHSKLQSASERSKYNHINMRTPWTTGSPQDLTLALYESASASRWSPHPLTTRAQHQTASSPPPPSTMSPPSSSSWSSHLRAISQVIVHILCETKRREAQRVVCYPTTARVTGATLGRFSPGFSLSHAQTQPLLSYNFGTTVRQLWDNFGTTLGQLWAGWQNVAAFRRGQKWPWNRGERILFFGPNTNTNIIRNQNFDRIWIRIRIIFVFFRMSEYEYEWL